MLNVTIVTRIRASKNGGVQAAQKRFGFASRREIPRDSQDRLGEIWVWSRTTIAAGGERVKEIQLYYSA